MAETKRCAHCGVVKPLEAFRRDRRGYLGWCRPCALAATNEWRTQNRDELAERRKARYRAALEAGLSPAEAGRKR